MKKLTESVSVRTSWQLQGKRLQIGQSVQNKLMTAIDYLLIKTRERCLRKTPDVDLNEEMQLLSWPTRLMHAMEALNNISASTVPNSTLNPRLKTGSDVRNAWSGPTSVVLRLMMELLFVTIVFDV